MERPRGMWPPCYRSDMCRMENSGLETWAQSFGHRSHAVLTWDPLCHIGWKTAGQVIHSFRKAQVHSASASEKDQSTWEWQSWGQGSENWGQGQRLPQGKSWACGIYGPSCYGRCIYKALIIRCFLSSVQENGNLPLMCAFNIPLRSLSTKWRKSP